MAAPTLAEPSATSAAPPQSSRGFARDTSHDPSHGPSELTATMLPCEYADQSTSVDVRPPLRVNQIDAAPTAATTSPDTTPTAGHLDPRPMAHSIAGVAWDGKIWAVPDVVVIEGGDLGCARLLVLLRARVTELAEGTVVHLSTSDPVAPIDLPVWCRMTRHEYLGTVEAAVPTYAVRVTAAPTATDPANPWRRAPEAS